MSIEVKDPMKEHEGSKDMFVSYAVRTKVGLCPASFQLKMALSVWMRSASADVADHAFCRQTFKPSLTPEQSFDVDFKTSFSFESIWSRTSLLALYRQYQTNID